MVGIVGSGEIPALLPLLGNGEGSEDAVNVAGIQQLRTGGGGNGGEFHVHPQLGSQCVGQVNFHAAVFSGDGVLIAEAQHGVLHAYPQNAPVYNGLHIRIQSGSGGGILSRGGSRGGRCGSGSRRGSGGAAAGGKAQHHQSGQNAG